MLDRIIGVTAIAVLIGFMAILIGFVPDVDLIIVIGVVCLMAVYDFYLMLFRNRNGEQ
ncbi:MAG: hypothetical protein RH942_10615 [Kiloniellaceae bacterium]